MNLAEQKDQPAVRSHCRSILVVEDDADIRNALCDVLQAEGHSVVTANHGKEALDRLSEIERPCLILLDLMMPVMSGAEFLTVMREKDVLAPIPVVIVSAFSEQASTMKGAQAFVRKPVDLDLLLDLVNRYC